MSGSDPRGSMAVPVQAYHQGQYLSGVQPALPFLWVEGTT